MIDAMARTGACLAAIVAIALALLPSSARAHALSPTRIDVSLAPGSVELEAHLPADQLNLALTTTWDDPTLADVVDCSRYDVELAERLRRHVAAHTRVSAGSGELWAPTVGPPRCTIENGEPMVVIAATFAAPPAARGAAAIEIFEDVVGHEVISHRSIVSVRRDFERGLLEPDDIVVGTLGFANRSIVFDRAGASAWRGVASMFMLGVRHIAEGTDHLLFVFALVLSAPLERRRVPSGEAVRWTWGATSAPRATAVKLVRLISAFTVGHSVTLVLGALGLVVVPSRPVEALVAASISVGALHAIRPLFAGREPVVAAGFGLVHGLAFASTLDGLGLGGRALVLALAGFNVGIEAGQLAIVLVVAPALMLLARRPAYGWVRVVLATGAIAASVFWFWQRVQ
ncbi:MAG: HupE/UreJ family protein [Myxococcales bacterium]|nr:HupE/UreJ family protein [Myxococcales bacterium]